MGAAERRERGQATLAGYAEAIQRLMGGESADIEADPLRWYDVTAEARALYERLPVSLRHDTWVRQSQELLESSESLVAIEVLRLARRRMEECEHADDAAKVVRYRDVVLMLASKRFPPGEWENKRLRAIELARNAGMLAPDVMGVAAGLVVADGSVRARASRPGSR